MSTFEEFKMTVCLHGLGLVMVLLSVVFVSPSVLFTYHKPPLFSNRFPETSRLSRSLSPEKLVNNSANFDLRNESDPIKRSENVSAKPIVFEMKQLAHDQLCSQHVNTTNNTTIEFLKCKELKTTNKEAANITDNNNNNTNELVSNEKEYHNNGNFRESNDNQFGRPTALSSLSLSSYSSFTSPSPLSLLTPGGFKKKSPMFGEREFLLAANAFTTDMTNKIVSNGLGRLPTKTFVTLQVDYV